MSLARRFQAVIDQLAGGNKKQFAAMTGKSASHIYKICRGSSRPSMAYLQALFDDYRVDLSWLLTGESNDGGNPAGRLNPADQVLAPMFDVKASAGAGALSDAEAIDEYFTFNKSFLSRQLGVSGEQLVFVTVDGDSMEPTLHHGDQVLVDMTQRSVRNNAVYLLNTEHGLLTKRLQQQAGVLQIHSDNPHFSSWQLDLSEQQENPVLGRIVWSARTL